MEIKWIIQIVRLSHIDWHNIYELFAGLRA